MSENYWIKACPKCHGDLYRSKDHFGDFVSCLQCARYLTEAEELNLLPGRWNSQMDLVGASLPMPLSLPEKIAA